MALCRITGIVYLPSGEIAARREVTFVKEPDSVTADYLGAVLPEPIRTRTDNDGSIDLTLITGNYYGFILGRGGHNKYTFRAIVPESATADFADLIAAVDPVEPLPSWLQQVIDARDEARASEVAAGVSAGDAADSADLAAALTAESPQSWADFARFLGYADGKVVWYNGVQFVRDRASDILGLASGPGWKPQGAWQPEHFGAVGDGVADDTAAVRAWAANPGRITARNEYAVSSQIDVVSTRIDATGARFVFAGSGFPRVFRLITPKSRWINGEIDGNMLASCGVYSEVGGKVEGVYIHSLRHTLGQVVGVWMVGPEGGEVIDCEFDDLSATGNGTGGDGPGACRAIVGSSTTAMNAPFRFIGNTCSGIAGEEGDVIQILVFDGTFPLMSAKWSVVKGNDMRGFNRRGVKIQASDVIIEDNYADANGVVSGLGPQNVLEGIGGNNLIFRRNITTASPGMRGVYATQSLAPELLTGIVFQDNIHNGGAGQDGFVAVGLSQAVLSGNITNGGRRAVVMSDCANTLLQGNVATQSVTDGTYVDFDIGSTNNRIIVDSNYSLGGTMYGAVSAGAPNSLFRNTVSMRQTGAVVVTTAGAVNSLVDGTVGCTSAGGVVALNSEAATAVSRNFQLGTFGINLGAGDIWVSGDPTTTRPERYHMRGTAAWNGGTGPINGWRCTVAGIPGTWVAF